MYVSKLKPTRGRNINTQEANEMEALKNKTVSIEIACAEGSAADGLGSERCAPVVVMDEKTA